MFYLPQEVAVIVVNVNRLHKDDASKSTEIFMGIWNTLYPDYTLNGSLRYTVTAPGKVYSGTGKRQLWTRVKGHL